MDRRAFTLVEIVIAIAIIAILAGVVAPNAFKAIEKSKVSKAIADVQTIKTAALAFYADVKLWPGSQWGPMPGDPFALAPGEPGAAPGGGVPYGEGFVTAPHVAAPRANVTASTRQKALKNLEKWNGPYLEKWSMTPWGMPYMWDYNNWDTSGDGQEPEHVVWLDLAHTPGPYNQNQKVPRPARNKLDRDLDSGDGKTKGMVQEMSGGFYGDSIEVFAAQGY